MFAERGFTATLADVAKAAGVGIGTVYRAFATKDDLIHDVYQPLVERAEHQAREASEAADPWTGIAGFLEQSVTTLAPDKGLRELVTGSYREALGWSRPPAPHRLAKLVEDAHNRAGAHLELLVDQQCFACVIRLPERVGEIRVGNPVVEPRRSQATVSCPSPTSCVIGRRVPVDPPDVRPPLMRNSYSA